MRFNIPAEFKNASGVYIIRNTVNEKVYVGSTNNFWSRYGSHSRSLSKSTHHSSIFQRFVNKHGLSVLLFEALEFCAKNKETLESREQYWLDYFNPGKRAGFNICLKAYSLQGLTRSAETRAKMSAAKKGYKPSSETIRKLVEANLGRKNGPISEETRLKLSAARKNRTPETTAKAIATLRANFALNGNPQTGKKVSQATREKLSEQRKGKSLNLSSEQKEKLAERAKNLWANPEYRAAQAKRPRSPLSEEHRLKLAEAVRKRWDTTKPEDRVLSAETKAKMSRSSTGRTLTPEHRAKISQKATGRKHTPETRDKMSVAAKARPSEFYKTLSASGHATKKEKKSS